ncbi:MAG: hypothetical protein DKM50_04240 [Candidatus Margulisiibacteriota bacterium]|nr:MAG: hypothetical protein A2X43_11345 [Candidatus Margulisbacteria bacterium GWD2_39_127]PZM82172.1 MAG: hypothetical protein DKM50_04240 [Candidatus Margulisiibacteriota bacterium]HAR64423.1 hypothetical protein [Candidatus Margulisiibacteriota bacterium]
MTGIGSVSSSSYNIDDVWSKIDSNSDGSVTKEEFTAQLKAAIKKRDSFELSNSQGQSAMMYGMQGNRPQPPSFSQILKKDDSDSDGKISAEEFSNKKAGGPSKGPKFADFDTDSDGYITETEFEASGEKQAAARGPSATAASEVDISSILSQLLGNDDDDNSSSISSISSYYQSQIASYVQNMTQFDSNSLFSVSA